MSHDALRSIEDKLDKQSWYLRCLHAWFTAGPNVDRTVVRTNLDRAAEALAPPPRPGPVVSDPNGGPPEPMT